MLFHALQLPTLLEVVELGLEHSYRRAQFGFVLLVYLACFLEFVLPVPFLLGLVLVQFCGACFPLKLNLFLCRPSRVRDENVLTPHELLGLLQLDLNRSKLPM